MLTSSSRRRRPLAVMVAAAAALVAVAAPASADSEKFRFFEETAEAFWAVPHECPDGSTVTATLLVRTTRDFEYPDSEDADPTARVQYQAVCPDGSSFTWGGILPATITSKANLKSVTASGSGIVRDVFGVTHEVSFDVTWTAVGPLVTTVNGPGSSRKQREAVASGVVTFDGVVLVDGQASTRPDRSPSFASTSRSSSTGVEWRLERGRIHSRREGWLCGRGRRDHTTDRGALS